MSLQEYEIRMLQFHTLFVHTRNFKDHCKEEWNKLTLEEKKEWRKNHTKNHESFGTWKSVEGETMKIIRYSIRNKERQVIAQVAVINQEDEFARGIVFCSPDDKFDREYGELHSYRRAIGALNKKKSIRCIKPYDGEPSKCNMGTVMDLLGRYNLLEILQGIDDDWSHKGVYNPVLTNNEVHLFKTAAEEV